MTSFTPVSTNPVSVAKTATGVTIVQPTLSVSATFAAPTVAGGGSTNQPVLSVTATFAAPTITGGASVTQPTLSATATFPAPDIEAGAVLQPTLNVTATFGAPSVLTNSITHPTLSVAATFPDQPPAAGAKVDQPTLTTTVSFTAPTIAGGGSVIQPSLNATTIFTAPSIFAGANISQPSLSVTATFPTQAAATGVKLQQPTLNVTATFPAPSVFIIFLVTAEPFRTYLVEFDHHDGNGIQTTRLTTGYGYRSASTDTPALAQYDPRISDAGSFGVTAFEPGRTVGRASINLGEMAAVNADGHFDSIITDGFDGRDLRIIRMPDERSPLTQGTRLATLTMAQAEVSTEQFRIRLRDRLGLLDTDIQDNTYAGTTTSGTAGGAEGDSQLEDRIKPLVFGRVLNVTPPPADRFNLIYQTSDSDVQDITAVYDKGVELIDPNTNQGSLTDLEDATVQPARFQTAHSIGLLKLGSPADGQITADVVEGATASDRTAAQVAKRILLDQTDLTTDDLEDSTFTDLDSKNSSEVGIFIGRQQPVIQAISEVLSSVGAFLTAKRDGKFAVYRLELPSVAEIPVVTYDENLIFEREDLERIPTGDEGGGVPAWKVTLKYKRNWTTQESDQLAGRAQACLGEDRKQFLRTEFQEAVKKDATVKNKHKRPSELTFDTLLLNRTAANAEAQRRLDIYKVLRERYQLRVKAAFFDGVDLNDTVKLKFDRLGLSGNGKLFKVIGYTYDFNDDVVDLDLWGGVTPN